MTKKFNPDPNAPRAQWVKFRVNDYELNQLHAQAVKLDEDLGLSNYLRSLVGFPEVSAGPPKGNKNRQVKYGPKLIYFDKNVYNVLKGQLMVSRADYNLIKRAINIGVIRIPASITVLEEALGIYRSKSKASWGLEKQVLSEIIDWNIFIKYHSDLLRDEILSYINGTTFTPFTRYPVTPEELFSDDPKQVADWVRVEAETESQKKEYADKSKPDQKQFREQLSQIPKKERDLSFSRLWNKHSQESAEYYVSRYGLLEKCKKRGIEGLLDLRVLRLTVGYELAYYCKKFMLDGKILPSDSRDHHHAVLSAITDIFVTEDERLAGILALIPMENYTVWSYKQFMRWLRLAMSGGRVIVPRSYYRKEWAKE